MAKEYIFPLRCDIAEHNPSSPETRSITYPMILADTPQTRKWALESCLRRVKLDNPLCSECRQSLKISTDPNDILIR